MRTLNKEGTKKDMNTHNGVGVGWAVQKETERITVSVAVDTTAAVAAFGVTVVVAFVAIVAVVRVGAVVAVVAVVVTEGTVVVVVAAAAVVVAVAVRVKGQLDDHRGWSYSERNAESGCVESPFCAARQVRQRGCCARWSTSASSK